MNASEPSSRPSDVVSSQESAAPAAELESWIAQWLPVLSQSIRHYHTRKRLVNWIAFLVGVVGLAICYLLVSEANRLVAGAVVGIGLWVLGAIVGNLFFVKPVRESGQAQAAEIEADIDRHGFAKGKIVRRFAADIKRSDYRDKLLQTIDPVETTLLFNHPKVIALLDAFSEALSGSFKVFDKIGQVSQLQDYAYQYAKAGFYGEATAMLCVAELLYKAIAVAAPQVKWQSSNTIYTATAPWGAYSFRAEVSTLCDIVTRRRARSQLLELRLALAGQAPSADLLSVEQGVCVDIRDQEIVDKCLSIATSYSMVLASTNGLEAILTTSYMPGHPTLLEMAARVFFKAGPFVPQIIEACIRRGAELESALLELLRGQTTNERFNAALALGILRSSQAAQAATELLNEAAPDALTRIGALFILAYAGETARQLEILPYLDDADETTAHAAAIALEHLPIPVPDATLEKHLRADHKLVQVRLCRHIARHTEVGPAVRDAVWVLVGSTDEDVSAAAAETTAALLVRDALFDFVQSQLADDADKTLRRRWSLLAGYAGTEAAVDLLLKRWDSMGRKADPDYANSLLKGMAATRSARVVPPVIEALGNEKTKTHALNALLMLVGHHPGEVHEAAKKIRDNVLKAFVLALSSNDADEIAAFAQAINAAKNRAQFSSPQADQYTQALQLAAILAHPGLESTLDTLRLDARGNEVQKPTWRYLATKASLAILARETHG